jgi:hypothetical protein
MCSDPTRDVESLARAFIQSDRVRSAVVAGVIDAFASNVCARQAAKLYDD